MEGVFQLQNIFRIESEFSLVLAQKQRFSEFPVKNAFIGGVEPRKVIRKIQNVLEENTDFMCTDSTAKINKNISNLVQLDSSENLKVQMNYLKETMNRSD